MSETKTLVAVLAHPDDEVLVAGTLMAQRARGDRVVVVWLTRGEMTEALGPLPTQEVARRREELAREAASLLDVECLFLDMGDTSVEATPGAAREVARVLASLRPDGVVTWGHAWVKGNRHPDHQATGKIARDAITLARIAKAVAPEEPFRGFTPVFTIRGLHSQLPPVVVDVAPHVDRVFALAELYRNALGFGEPQWLESRLRSGGRPVGLDFAEAFEAWESRPGTVSTLLPTEPSEHMIRHPDVSR